VDPHVGAVERLYATNLGACESSDCSDAEADGAPVANAQATGSPRSTRPTSLGKVPRRTTESEGGRQAYVINCGGKGIPNGNSKTNSSDKSKKERKRLKEESDAAAAASASADGTPSKANGSSTLRLQLFPELDGHDLTPGTPSLGTTTDDGGGSDSEHSVAGGGGGEHTKKQQQANGNGHGHRERPKVGRKDSWKLDVVNPIRLFDGVLES
jgi:hypothetical protein